MPIGCHGMVVIRNKNGEDDVFEQVNSGVQKNKLKEIEKSFGLPKGRKAQAPMQVRSRRMPYTS